MNTALHASPPTESRQSALPERTLSIPLPREEELRNLSLSQRLALRVALRLLVRARSAAPDRAREALRAVERLRLLDAYETARISHSATRQML